LDTDVESTATVFSRFSFYDGAREDGPEGKDFGVREGHEAGQAAARQEGRRSGLQGHQIRSDAAVVGQDKEGVEDKSLSSSSVHSHSIVTVRWPFRRIALSAFEATIELDDPRHFLVRRVEFDMFSVPEGFL